MKYSKVLFPFESRWVNIDGSRIHYIDEGTGPILLFSHAAIGSSFMYRIFIQELRPNFRCIALDFPGFGLSDDHISGDYNIESQSQVLKKFISFLGLTDIIGLGHDTGGPSLFKVAIDQPKLFSGLVLTDTFIFPTSSYPKIHFILGMLGSKLFNSFNARTNFLVKGTMSQGIRTRKVSQMEKRQYQELFTTRERRKRITEVLYSLRLHPKFMEELARGFEEKLQDKPSLLIYGEKDPLTQMGVPQRIHEMLNHSTLRWVSKEGHFPHEGKPELMAGWIHEWVERTGFF